MTKSMVIRPIPKNKYNSFAPVETREFTIKSSPGQWHKRTMIDQNREIIIKDRIRFYAEKASCET